MTSGEIIGEVDRLSLGIVCYGDPRLRQLCAKVDEFDLSLRLLVERMFELMLQGRGVGLAAPQVGLPVRLFVASPTFQETDSRVYINPEIVSAEGEQEEEEGCLSFPGIYSKVKRHSIVTIRAANLDGETFDDTGHDLTARIFEHEIDHLDGRLLVDRMGTVARLSHRRALKELQQRYVAASGEAAR